MRAAGTGPRHHATRGARCDWHRIVAMALRRIVNSPRRALALSSVDTALAPLSAERTTSLQQHVVATWRYLRMHGASPHEADDLTQEAFVIAVRKNTLQLEGAATAAFLQRTARFLFLRARRDADAAIHLADEVDALWQRDCAADDGEGLLARLRGCVERLPERSRRAVDLSYGLSALAAERRVDVAAAMGLQENGLKTLLQRVRQQLRACVERRTP